MSASAGGLFSEDVAQHRLLTDNPTRATCRIADVPPRQKGYRRGRPPAPAGRRWIWGGESHFSATAVAEAEWRTPSSALRDLIGFQFGKKNAPEEFLSSQSGIPSFPSANSSAPFCSCSFLRSRVSRPSAYQFQQLRLNMKCSPTRRWPQP